MQIYIILVVHGKAVARSARHLPCPLASTSEVSGLDTFQGPIALARLEGLQLHPVPFRKFSGRRGEVLFRPTPSGPLALARARKLELFRVRQCRSGGIQNIDIVPEKWDFHKVIVTRKQSVNPTNSVT